MILHFGKERICLQLYAIQRASHCLSLALDGYLEWLTYSYFPVNSNLIKDLQSFIDHFLAELINYNI